MKQYRYDKKHGIIYEDGMNVLELSSDVGEKFLTYCGDLLCKALNEEEMWKIKLKQFADTQIERKKK